MSRKRDSLLYKKDINTLDDALEYIEKLKSRIIKDRAKIRNLSSENRTLKKAWYGTEDYLHEVTDGKPLSEVIKAAKDGSRLKKGHGPCPKCGVENLTKLLYSGFHIVICENNGCGYRERINEVSSDEDEQS